MKATKTMKKLIFLSLLLVCATACFSQKFQQETDTTKVSETKLLFVQGDVSSFKALVDALDKSSAPHTTVEALKSWIVGQVNQQLQLKDKPKTVK